MMGLGISRLRKEEKEQGAMEYLATYGWSILIIAIVLALLFTLGVFGSVNLPFVCLGAPGFLCMASTMSSSGAVTVTFGYIGSAPLTITGLGCNVTTPLKGPSVESQITTVYSGQTKQLVFQCPLSHASIGSTIPVYLWLFYDTGKATGLKQPYARGILEVNYETLLWNITQWSVTSNAVDLLPYGSVSSSPNSPLGTEIISNAVWSSFRVNGSEGWAYSTDYHKSDVYNGIQIVQFPISPINFDNVPCNAPYASKGFTATTHAHMSGNYNIISWTDDGEEIFYRNMDGGGWSSAFSGNAWVNEPPTFYANTLTLLPGNYELTVDYIDTCDPAGLSMVFISPPPRQI